MVLSSSLPLGTVPDRSVAVDAVGRLEAAGAVPEDVIDEVVVAVETVRLQDFLTHGPKADRFVEVLEGEALGVPVPVLGLDRVLGDGAVRNVAIVARRRRLMTGFLPAVVLVAH